MKKINLLVISLVIVILIISAWLMLKSTDERKTGSMETQTAVALTVSETIVTEAEWPEIVKATGPISAWQEAVIGAEISGQRLIDVIADVGDTVKKGEVLARFNTETLKAEYAELEANWIKAESNQKRALTLRDSGAMSEQAINDYLNQAAVAKAQMEAKALQLKYTDIVAPDDGVISARNAMLGSVGSAGDELFRLIRQNRLEWRGELTTEQVTRVTKGLSVTLALPNGNMVKGSVRQIAPSFNPDTRMATIFVDIEAGGSAKAGMYAHGEITLGKQISLSVPAKSIVIRNGHYYVFIIRYDTTGTTVSIQEVQVGLIRGGKAQILSGIYISEHIVLQGAGFLNDGDIVRVLPEKGNEE